MISLSQVSFRLIIFCGILCLLSCKGYQFSSDGFMVENDPHYHNISSHLSVAAQAENTETTQLSPENRRALRSFGVKPGSTEVLFVSKLPSDSSITIVSWQAKEGHHHFSNYLPQVSRDSRYLYKKKQKGGQQLVHAVYESPAGPQVGLIFYNDGQLDEAKINQFLTKDVRLTKELFPDLTAAACVPEEQIGWGIDIPAELVSSEYTLLKIYRLDATDQEQLILYSLRQPNEFYYLAFSVCKDATYRAVYSDLAHKEIWSTTKHTDEIMEEDRLLMESMGY